jgi:hypothetical protein
MRIAGTLLLIVGFLLCISIAWAALGFLMMGFGLICLMIAERRQKRLAASPVSRQDKIAARQEPSLFPAQEDAQPQASTNRRSHEIGARREPSRFRERKSTKPTGLTAPRWDQIDPQWEPSRLRGRRNAQPEGSTAPHSDKIDPRGEPAPESEQPNLALVVSDEPIDRRQSAIDPYSYDLERWRSLVRNDADISRAASSLAPFGKKYVDELAKTYLVLNDKDYLPIILKKIAAAARKDSGKDTASAAVTESDPNTDLISFALSKTQSLGREQVLDARTVFEAVPDKFVFVSSAAQITPDAKPRQASVRSAPARRWPEPAPSAAARNPEIEGSDTGPAVETTAISPARREAGGALSPNDVEDLTDLLKNFGLDARASAKR